MSERKAGQEQRHRDDDMSDLDRMVEQAVKHLTLREQHKLEEALRSRQHLVATLAEQT